MNASNSDLTCTVGWELFSVARWNVLLLLGNYFSDPACAFRCILLHLV